MSDITALSAWKALGKHYEYIKSKGFSDNDFRLQAGGITLDFSNNIASEETVVLFEKLFHELGIAQKINRLPAHTDLRAGEKAPDEVKKTFQKMKDFTDKVHGSEIKSVVNIGIGGGRLGPEMAVHALKDFRESRLSFRFVSSADKAEFDDATVDLDPKTTLFTINSKSFETPETMQNFKKAKEWGKQSQFVAVTSSSEKAQKLGIDSEDVFMIPEAIGGRYSMMGAVGLSIMLSVGHENFTQMLLGAKKMDEHFQSAGFSKNLPMALAAMGIWYNNFFGADSYAVFPYGYRLKLVPSYLQQLVMESSGKPSDIQSGQIVWGMRGTDNQHSVMQLILGGTKMVPADFIGFESADKMLSANLKAQTQVMKKQGKPFNLIMADKLAPEVLGSLIALYEHKVLVEGLVWGIDSFNQPAVEEGKKLAKSFLD